MTPAGGGQAEPARTAPLANPAGHGPVSDGRPVCPARAPGPGDAADPGGGGEPVGRLDPGGVVEPAASRLPAPFAAEIRGAVRYERGLAVKAAGVLAVLAVILVLRALVMG